MKIDLKTDKLNKKAIFDIYPASAPSAEMKKGAFAKTPLQKRTIKLFNMNKNPSKRSEKKKIPFTLKLNNILTTFNSFYKW